MLPQSIDTCSLARNGCDTMAGRNERGAFVLFLSSPSFLQEQRVLLLVVVVGRVGLDNKQIADSLLN